MFILSIKVLSELHDLTTQKFALFIGISVNTSDPKYCGMQTRCWATIAK
jgi:hypothetical protein